jgi:hypothetical protein
MTAALQREFGRRGFNRRVGKDATARGSASYTRDACAGPGCSYPRPRIVHSYDDLDPDIIWRVAAEDMEPVIAALERALTVR